MSLCTTHLQPNGKKIHHLTWMKVLAGWINVTDSLGLLSHNQPDSQSDDPVSALSYSAVNIGDNGPRIIHHTRTHRKHSPFQSFNTLKSTNNRIAMQTSLKPQS